MVDGVSSGTYTVREQFYDLEDYLQDTPEDHIKSPIHHCLIEITHDGEKGDTPTLRSKDRTLVTKHVNEVNEVLKRIPVRNLSELKYLVRASSLLACEKVNVRTDHTINKK